MKDTKLKEMIEDALQHQGNQFWDDLFHLLERWTYFGVCPKCGCVPTHEGEPGESLMGCSSSKCDWDGITDTISPYPYLVESLLRSAANAGGCVVGVRKMLKDLGRASRLPADADIILPADDYIDERAEELLASKTMTPEEVEQWKRAVFSDDEEKDHAQNNHPK